MKYKYFVNANGFKTRQCLECEKLMMFCDHYKHKRLEKYNKTIPDNCKYKIVLRVGGCPK